MSEDSAEPFGKETAQATGELAKFGVRALDSLDGLFGYGAQVVGTLPRDVVGVLGADWLKEVRLRNRDKLRRRTIQILKERGLKEPFDDVSPSIAVPLIEAAADESREELAQLWAKLLAAAVDPARKGRMRQSFISTLKQMDPLDAKILEALYLRYPSPFGQSETGRDSIAQKLRVSQDETLVSFGNLEKMNCIGFGDTPKINPIISPFGKLLMEALR
jgi:Abortive infection alpha